MSCGPFAVLSCHFISPLVTFSLSHASSSSLPSIHQTPGRLTYSLWHRLSMVFALFAASIRPQDIISISIIAISSSPLIRSELGVRVESLFTYHYSRSREAQI
uniref:Putative secreted protein n=1 Tax=Anopheles darlingi TaxID=43151 RepID=A0A2M4DAZ2_ANODA